MILSMFSIFCISFAFSSSVTCTYRFMAIPMFERPKIICKVFGRIPLSIHRVANVCLRTCIENLGMPSLSHSLNNEASQVEFLLVRLFYKEIQFFKLYIDCFDFFKFLFLPFQDCNSFFCQRHVTIARLAFRLSNSPFTNTVSVLYASLYMHDTLLSIKVRPFQAF